MNAELLESLLGQMESETLDFKSAQYDLASEHGRISFVKDVVCMANTPREGVSHIVLGVQKCADGRCDLTGVTAHPDDALLQSQFSDRVYPVPTFSYTPTVIRGQQCAVIEIPPVRVGPCLPTKDSGNMLRQWQMYFRRGSTNDLARGDDEARIYGWFGKGVVASEAYSSGDQKWDEFLRAAGSFVPEFQYVLIVSPCPSRDPAVVGALGRAPWLAAIDFDAGSDTSGVLAGVKPEIESRRSVHLFTLQEHGSVVGRGSVSWFFARGLSGREGTVEEGPWQQWIRKYGRWLAEQMRVLAGACVPAPTKIIVLWYQPSLIRHLQSTLEAAVASFGETLEVLVVTDDVSACHAVVSEVGGRLFEIPFEQFCSGLLTVLGRDTGVASGEAVLPSSSGAPIAVTPQTRLWVEEEIELVHMSLGLTPPTDRVVGRDFLRGAEISWYELGLHYDIDRDKSRRLERQIEAELAGRRTSRVNLYHGPGAGGTTLGRRLLWNLREKYPCGILRRTQPAETAERIFRIASLTGRSVLLLVDGAEIAEREVDELYDNVRSRHVPVVLLQVLRRFTPQTEGPRAVYIGSDLSESEAHRFAHVFAREKPERRASLEALLATSEPRLRSAFYFGLVTFEEDFLGLESFVRSRIETLSEPQREVVGFLALAHHYGQRTITGQAFVQLLGVPASRVVRLREALPAITQELLVESEPGRWRTAHDLIATEVLQQMLTPSGGDRRRWKQSLSNWAVEFVELCRGSMPVQSEEMLELLRRTLIYRDNAELLGTERSASALFSQLLQDIPATEGALAVLRRAVDLYPEEAHFWAHLGRYHSVQRREHAEAARCLEKAIALEEHDSVLHHMRGMALRQQVYEEMAGGAGLDEVVVLAKEVSKSFGRARDLNPDDEHGYISEVQMLARVLDYAGREGEGGLLKYLSGSGVDPYVRDAFERAEDLLERVRRSREGQGASSFEEDCRARLDALYGRHDRALEIWDNLLTRGNVYGPPVRRQIVWTYLARRGRAWDRVPAREADRIVSLLEENLREEPESDVNLRLWVQAVRRASYPPTLEAVIERVSYWRATAGSLEATFYLYVLYALQAVDGSAFGRDAAIRFVEECRGKARLRRNRSRSFEWLGSGTGVSRLVHHSQLGEWGREQEFWSNTEPLVRVPGRIARIEGPQAGQIEVQGGLNAFFVPARGDYSKGRSENRPVTCWLGFSFDGLRAWEVRDQ